MMLKTKLNDTGTVLDFQGRFWGLIKL